MKTKKLENFEQQSFELNNMIVGGVEYISTCYERDGQTRDDFFDTVTCTMVEL